MISNLLITPDKENTEIYILSGCPLDSTYKHTINFDVKGQAPETDKAFQEQYFLGLTKLKIHYSQYTRYEDNHITVPFTVAQLLDCNYMMFKNNEYENKWFYAFITNVEYVNDEASDIYYQIDVMQTFMFDYYFKPSYVEREHTETDNIGEHTIPENLYTGELQCIGYDEFNMSPFNACILATETPDGKPATPGFHGGVFTPLHVIDTPQSEAQIENAIAPYTALGKQDAIVDAYFYPAFLRPSSDQYHPIPKKIWNTDFTKPAPFGVAKPYKPRNNKLHCSPFLTITIENNLGSSMTLSPELFAKGSDGFPIVRFYLRGTYIGVPNVTIHPISYKGLGENLTYSLTMNNFPKIAIVGDAYKAYLARNKNSIAVSREQTHYNSVRGQLNSIGQGAAGLIGNAAGGNIGGAVSSIGSMVSNFFNSRIDEKQTIERLNASLADIQNIPDTIVTQANNDFVNYAYQRFAFSAYVKQVRPEIARTIDDYFDLYGYACHRVKKPNWSVRPHWTYVKTVGCNIGYSSTLKGMPQAAATEIKRIMDNGITVWEHAEEIGDYSLDNRPV